MQNFERPTELWEMWNIPKSEAGGENTYNHLVDNITRISDASMNMCVKHWIQLVDLTV